MQIFFTIFGGPHDGYRISLNTPMDCVKLEDSSLSRNYCASISYWPRPIKIIRYTKRRVFVQKYGRIFLKDVYASNEYDFKEALREFRHYFNPVFKKQDHLRVVF
ncbi:hypothetical protein NQ637_17750 [Acinetobacter baumannii]|nr:hypothetical protein [Acinetobacter baumannii]